MGLVVLIVFFILVGGVIIKCIVFFMFGVNEFFYF